MKAPRTFAEAVRYFADPKKCARLMIAARWPDGITCPSCKSGDVTSIPSRDIWRCKSCRRQFSIKAGTIFEDSALGLEKWFPVLWVVGVKGGSTARISDVARALDLPPRTAWSMLYRARLALQREHA